MQRIQEGMAAVEWRWRPLKTVQMVTSRSRPFIKRAFLTSTKDKLASKAQKITIKLPWEIMTIYSDVLQSDDEEDEDDIEAHEASIQRLKVRVSTYTVERSTDVASRKRMTQHAK